MKISGMEIFPLHLPFVTAFQNTGQYRAHSDSIIIKLYADDGSTGYGEAIARPLVTGETVPTCIQHMQCVLWPAVRTYDYPEIALSDDPLQSLTPIERSLPDPCDGRVIAWHGARAAFETALIDLLLKRQRMSVYDVLRPRRPVITYSGVIGLGTIEYAREIARRYRRLGMTDYKCYVMEEDIELRLYEIRTIIGPEASLRLDANCAFDVAFAGVALSGLERFNVVCIEQPTHRIDEYSLARLEQSLCAPIMADESLVTVEDSRRLIAAKACGWFNLHIAKCGGLVNVLRIAHLATAAGIRFQIGAQLGETAILSAVGRHLAAHLAQAEFVEGSYGTALLIQDIAESDVAFGAGGKAPLIHGPGIGIDVKDSILHKYATQILSLGSVNIN